MIVSAIVINFAWHHERAFHEIEHIEWSFMVLFFILAGASLEYDAVEHIGVIGAACLILRFVARVCGRWIGAWL